MAEKDPSLVAAYALETPDDSRRLYADWAQTYDSDFAASMDYQMPRIIALTYAEVADGAAPVLDVGAGTGLIAKAMPVRDRLAIDALDISDQMLEVARSRRVYRRFFQCDLTQPLPIEDGEYGAIISAGTFTYGHVGPQALDELMRIAKAGAVFVLSIHAKYFEERGFKAKFAALEPHITGLEFRTVNIYGPAADQAHKDDQALVAVFHKR